MIMKKLKLDRYRIHIFTNNSFTHFWCFVGMLVVPSLLTNYQPNVMGKLSSLRVCKHYVNSWVNSLNFIE
jgi:hypothetical protein